MVCSYPGCNNELVYDEEVEMGLCDVHIFDKAINSEPGVYVKSNIKGDMKKCKGCGRKFNDWEQDFCDTCRSGSQSQL